MTTPVSARAGERGVSLAEAVVAVGLFGLAIMSLTALLVGTIRAAGLAEDLATARFLAAQRMDQIRAARYVDTDRDGSFYDSDGDGTFTNVDRCVADVDEINTTVFFTEGYGEVDALNGTRFSRLSCDIDGTMTETDIKTAGVRVDSSSYPATDQGRQDFLENHAQYNKFRREVYVYSSADQATAAITNVTLDGPRADGLDNLVVTTATPSAPNTLQTNYVKYVFVRVKWTDSHDQLHHVTLSSEKVYGVDW